MSVAVALLLALAAGVPVALAADRSNRGVLLLPAAWLYGTGAVFLVLLGLAAAGVEWTSATVVAGLTGLAAIAAVVARRRVGDPMRIRLSWIDAATALAVALYGWRALASSPSHWDFSAIWGLKARIFFEARTIDWTFLSLPWNDFAHPDYPLLVPFNVVLPSLLSGAWDERWLGVLWLAWGAALLVIVRALAAAEAAPVVAGTVTFAAAGFALQPQIGLAEVPLIAFGAASVLFVRRGLLTRSGGSLRHGALLLGFAASTKNEGLALLAAVALALALTRDRRRIVALWPALAIALPWQVIRFAHELPSDLATGNPLERLTARITSLDHVAAALVRQLPMPWFWAAIIAGSLLVWRELLRREQFTVLTTGILFVFFVGSYLVTPHDIVWHIATSWMRVAPQLGVPFLFVVMLALARSMASEEDPL